MLCAVVIIWNGLRPVEAIPRVRLIPHTDKLLHFLAYAGFGALVLRVFVPFHPRRPVLAGAFGWMAVLLLPALLGALDETLQGIANRGRTADIWDWVADACGGAAVVAMAWWDRRRI
jgi:VanZ family protein